MEIQAQICDIADISARTFTNRETGEARPNGGEIRLLTTKPSQIIEVRLTEELWNQSNKGEYFKKLVGKRTEYLIQPVTTYMNGQAYHNNQLFSLPEIKAQ